MIENYKYTVQNNKEKHNLNLFMRQATLSQSIGGFKRAARTNLSLNACICWLFILYNDCRSCDCLNIRCEQCRLRRWQVSRPAPGAGWMRWESVVCPLDVSQAACSWRVCNSSSPNFSLALLVLSASPRTLKNTHLLFLSCLIWFFAPSLALTRKLFSPACIWLKLNARSRACHCDALCIILLLRLSRRGRVARRSSQKWICTNGVASTRRQRVYFNQRSKWIN
jgi:hypothetical protein